MAETAASINLTPKTALTKEIVAKWAIIYPIYINKKKTIAEGRKMPLNKCVDTPTLKEIFEACQALKFPVAVEPNKCYSR